MYYSLSFQAPWRRIIMNKRSWSQRNKTSLSTTSASRTWRTRCHWRGSYRIRWRNEPSWTASQFLLLLYTIFGSNLADFCLIQLCWKNTVAKKTWKFFRSTTTLNLCPVCQIRKGKVGYNQISYGFSTENDAWSGVEGNRINVQL